MKKCTKCKNYKKLVEFSKDSSKKDCLASWCKLCLKNQRKYYYTKYPWKQTLRNIKDRCNNTKHKDYKNYGKRRISCLITTQELKKLWFRDKAYLLKQPTIDREDNNGNYKYSNCNYIEKSKNSTKDSIKPIVQFNLNKQFIKTWCSTTKASEILNINKGNISSCLKKKRKTAGKFIWKYKLRIK